MSCAGEAPDSGALATGPDGALLLLLHSRAAQKAIAVQLPADPLGEESARVSVPCHSWLSWHMCASMPVQPRWHLTLSLRACCSCWHLLWAVNAIITCACLHGHSGWQARVSDVVHAAGGLHNQRCSSCGRPGDSRSGRGAATSEGYPGVAPQGPLVPLHWRSPRLRRLGQGFGPSKHGWAARQAPASCASRFVSSRLFCSTFAWRCAVEEHHPLLMHLCTIAFLLAEGKRAVAMSCS